MNNDNLRNLYKTFEKEGYEMPSYEDFEKDMQDDNNLHDAWETLKGDGYEPPEYDTFKTDMGFGAAPEAQPAETVSVSGQGTPQVNYSQAVYDRYENQVPKRTGNNDAVVQSLDEIAAEMEREKPGSSKPGFFEGMSFEGMGKQLKEGGKNVIGKILGFFDNKQDKGSIGNMEAAAMPTEEQMVQHGGSIGYQAGESVGTLADTAGTGAVVGNVIQKNAQPAFYEEQQQRVDPAKPLVEQELMNDDRGFGEFMQQGIDRFRKGQQETDPTLDDEGNQLQIPLYNQEAALRGDIQRIDADVMRKFNEELASNKQQAGEYMRNTPGNPFAPTEVNLMNIGREANKIADPSKAIESAIKYADEQTKDMPDEVRYQVIESLLGQMEEQLINERIPSGTAEYVFWRGFKDSDLGRIMSSVVDTNYEKYLDQVAASRYKAGFWENLGKGAVTLASDMWEYVLPAGAAGKAGKWAGGKISGRIMNDLIRRGVPKSQAARIAERLTANSVGKSILQHGASNAVTFGTAGAISGAVEGLTEPATVDGMSIERARMERDMHMPDPIFGVDQHDALDAKIKEAEAEQYSAKNLFGKIFERAAWGVGTGVATSFGAPLGEIIGHGRGVAGKILGDATRLGVNATAMTGVGALEQATTPGAQPLTFEDLLLAEANNLLTFGALEARGIYNRAKNYRNIQQFEKAYDITDADKAKMKDLGYGDMLDAVEQLTTGKTAGAQPAEKKPNVITRLVNGERVSEVKMPQTKESSGVDQVESQNLKNGLQQLVNDYNAGRISEEEARKWYGLITGDYSQQLQPITGVSQRTDISPEGKVQHFVDYLDAQGRRVRTVEAKTEEEAKQLSDDYRQEAQLNQISALEDMVTDKDVQEHFAETVRRDFGGSSGSETEGTETISTGGVREKIDRLNDLRARKKLHEMGEGKALTAEEERMLEEGLSTYERDVANIFGREDQLQEALQKQAEGGDLLPYEESLIQSAQNIYRNHAGHSKAASDFAREFEKRNGMEEGTLSQILEKKDRSEAEQKAVDDYVTDLQEYLRPRTEQVEIEEAGNPTTNATESVVDMAPGVEPPTETPAGDAAQTAVASEAYSKGQAAVQANDAAAMRNIGYEMQKADARMSKLFTDDEAKAIYDAVESGDEEALATVTQKHTEPAKLDAIEKLKEAHDAMRGIEDAINDSYIGNDEAIRAEIEPYQNEQGEIVFLKLSNGSSVYYVSGDLNNAYGTVMVAYTGEDGSVRHAQVPVKEITETGTPVGIDDYVQVRAEMDRKVDDERYKGIISGTELRKGNQVELTMGNTTGVFTVDGFFSNGDVQLRDENGGVIRMTKDEALEMMQATEDKRINQDLADEQAAYKEAERVRQEEEKARLEAQRKFEEERRGKIAEIQKTVVDEAAARPQPTEQNEEATKWNGLAIADVADAEGVRKYLLDKYESEADADTFMNEQRRILKSHQRDEIQPEIDKIRKQLDDYTTGKVELSDEELTGLITQLSGWETEQNRLNGVAEALKDISDALPKTYAERNADVLKNSTPYEQRMAELSKARTNEDKVRIARKLYGNDPDVGTLFDDLDVPADATELVSMFLKPRVLRWEGVDQGGVHLRGVEDELGKHMKRGVGRNVDSNNINTFLAAKGEGKTVDEFVHDIWESPENHPVGAEEKRFDDTEIRNALINLLLSAKNPTEIRDLIIDGRIAEAERILKEVQDREEEYEMQSWAESYHLPASERESYESELLRVGEEYSSLSDDDIQKINAIFAEQNELRDEQNRRSQEMDRQPIVAGAGGEGSGGQAEVQRQGAEADVTKNQGRQVNREGENLTDGTAVPGSDVAGGAQGEFERSIDELGRIEEEWNDKILDYVSQHYPTQAVVSAQTNSPKGKAERKAMLEDPVYQEMVRQQKEALDAADKKVTEAYKKEEEKQANLKPKTELEDNQNYSNEERKALQYVDGESIDEYVKRNDGIAMKEKLEEMYLRGKYGDQWNTIEELFSNKLTNENAYDMGVRAGSMVEDNHEGYALLNLLNNIPVDAVLPFYDGVSSFTARLARAINETNTNPTDGQKEAGNYKKGHLQFGGYNFTVENPKGSVRSGKDASGKPWSITMHNTYGYLTGKGNLGKDGDHLDVFINDDADLDNWNGNVFVVDQVNSDGSFDEHKIMYGFDNEVDALRNYLMNYSRPWHGMGNITGVDKATFDKWVESSNRKQKPFAETRFGDNRDVVEKVMDGIEKKKEVADLSEPKIENNHPSSKVIQGLEDITVEDFLEGVRGDIESILSDNDLSDIVTIKGLALHGSRMRGDAREDSDIDVVVEYEGDISEDGLFNILSDADLAVNGIPVDINPITKGKSGTLEQYMEQSRKYDEEIAKKRQKTEQSKYQLSSETDSEGNRFFEKEGSIDLWTLPKLFAKARRQDAPIRLTERNLQHIIDEHHKEIGNTDDVLAFLDNIFNNAPVLRKARGRGMFVVVEQEKTDKAAIIKLMPSENGDYYNVETAGYYRKNKWKEYEDVIADLREPDQSDAVTDVSKPQTSNQNGRKSINAETQTSSSEGKDKKNIDTLQEKGNKNAKKNENKIEDVGEVIAGARKDMRRKIAESIDSATEKTLIDLPFSKAYKKPDLKKAVEEGALREEDATFYDAFFSTMVNPSKPKVVQSELRMKKWKPDYKTKVERWAEATHEALQVLKEFVEATEEQRDEIIRKALENKYPMRDVELAEIEKRKEWNKDRDFKAGDKTTPNPLWVTYEVMKQLDYKPGEKLDIPYGLLKADAHGTGYYLYNAKNETNYNFHPQSVEDGISDIVWLAKLKRGDADIQHPISSFSTPSTKSETGETGRYRVIWGGSNIKTRDFDNKKEADEFAASRKQQSLVSPIREVVRRFGYKVVFRNPLTNDKIVVDDQEFDTKNEAQAYLEDNYDELNEKLNNILSEQRKDKKRTELKADDLVFVSMVRGNDNKWTYGVIMDKKYANYYGMPRVLKEGFATRDEAKKYAESIKDEVFSTYKNYKTKQKNIVYFDTGENSRLGEDYRGGKDVSAEDFMNTFGFRGVQFGNWTNQADRQMAVNQAYDAFLDLAKLIGVSPQALSLNGELGIAFGARGAGGFAAHYEPGEIVINLTKTQGAGSLAHEWWHALDNYFARAAGEKGGMVTDDSRLEMRPELRDAYNTLTRQVAASKYFARSKAKGDYWGRMHEVTARLLAEWVDQELKKRGELNTFLSRGANTERTMENNYLFYEVMQKIAGKEVMPFEEFKKTDEAMSGSPYPSKAEVDSFADAMRNIFDVMQERKDEETGNIMLYEPDFEYNAQEPRPRRRNPKVVSHIEGNLFPEEKEGELFDDKKAAAKPQPTKKPESKLEKLSDKQLLEGIGQNANSKDWDLYIDEYDKRHRDEYQDALAAYSDMLEKENVSLEDAYGMYADVAAKWNDKGFASDERSKLMAQVDALEEYVDRLESEAIEREEAEEEEAAAKQQPAEKKARYEEDKTDVRAHGYDLTKIRLRELGEGEVSHVERRYVENGSFSFTGGEHIESAADVAYIFRQLEDAAVENSFMVLIKDGVPTVIHLAIGSYNAVHAPIEQAFAAYKEIDPDNVIFLHNHPSGNLVASREDLALQKKVEAMFGRKALPGIIINTKSGKYAEFNSEGSNQIGLRPKSVDKDIPVRVFNFSKQVFAKDWNPETAFEGSDSRSMAAFVSSHRLGDHNKMSLIVMDQAGHITGNIFLPWTTTNEISKQANALQIATYVNQMGGRYALIYGNTTVTDSKDIKILKTNLDGYNVKLRDVMTIEGSAHDKGLLFEPDVVYKGSAKDMMEAVGKQYHGKEMVFLDKTHGEEQLLKDLGMYDEVTKMKGSPEYDAIMEHLRKNLGKAGASYNRDTKKIYIFAPEMTSSYAEEAYFHENIHAILDDWYGDGKRTIAERFWNVMPDDGKVNKAYVKEKSTDKSEYAEEAFAYWLSRSMQDGDVADFLNYFDEADKERINNILKTFGYDAEKESERRVRLRRNQHVSEAQSGYSETDEGLSRSESEGSGAGVKSGTLAYIKDVTLPSESSTSAQGDQYTKPAGVDSSEGKDKKNSDTLQEKPQKYDYGEINTGEKEREAKELATKAVMQVLDNSGVSYHEVSQAEAMAVLRKTQALREGRSFHVDTPVFVSNALKAVEGIRQEKATPEQWLAMIQKNGGLKAGEDKWLGLSDWLKEQASAKRSLTKNEVLDYIRENQIQVEETNYKEYFDVDDNPQMQKFRKEFDGLVEKYESEKNAVEQEANTFNDEMYQKYGGGWANDPERLNEEDRKRNDDMVERWNNMNDSDPHDLAFREMVDNYGDDFEMAFEVNYGNGNLEPQMDMYDEEISDAAKHFLQFEDEPINSTRLSYTTEGLENKKEIALTVPTIDPYNESDNIHFGDAGGGRAVAWIRFGETTLPEDGGEKRRAAEAIEADNAKWYAAHQDFARYGIGDADGSLSKESEERNERQRKAFAEAYAVPQTRKVLVIDEIQSKRHQDAREKGYISDDAKSRLEEARKNVDFAQQEYDNYVVMLKKQHKGEAFEDFYSDLPVLQREMVDSLEQDVYKASEEFEKASEAANGVPDAPFEKNWHELAMKRMLRYAAENGYDKIAWTTGDQQAERYNIGNVVEKIISYDYPEVNDPDGRKTKKIEVRLKDGETMTMRVGQNGKVIEGRSDTEGKDLTDVVGKELAKRIMDGEGKDGTIFDANKDLPAKVIEGEGLRIGGEGMKGFYDQMIPRFMDKYGKKWGVKTGEVELPGLAPAGKYSSKTAKMWAIDVTPEMKESVMQGQPMFSVAGKEPMVTSEGVVYGYTDGKDIYLTDEGINPETPAHEYGHLWVKAIKKNRPDLWENIKDLMREDEVSQKIYQKLLGDNNYNQIHGDEDELYEEVLTNMGGAKNRERFEQAAREVLDEAEGMDETMKIANVISKIRRAFRKLWDWIGKDLFGIKKFKSVDEVTDRMMYDFVEGTDVKTGVEDAVIKQPTEPRNVSFQAGKGKPRQKKGEGMASYFNRLREWERRKMAEEDESDPMPIMPDTEGIEDFEELKRIQDEYRKLYQEWEVRHGIADLENADLGLYDVATGKKDVSQPTEEEQLLDQEIDARVLQDIGNAVGFNTTPEGARKQVKYAVINRRKNLESASAEDAIFIHDLTKRLDDIAKNISSQGGEKVTGKMLREALPDIIEGTYGYDIVKADNGEWIRMDHRAAMPIQMTPSLQKVLDDIKDWYDEFYHVLEDAGLRGNAGYIAEGYVNHIWDKEKSDPKAWKEYVENYQRTKSPNMKKREIPTYAEGIAVGLVPKFTDITDIMSYYSRSNNEAVANRKFLDDLACINIDELNKDGEVVRSLPLITNVEPYHLDKESYTKPYDVPGVGDVWVHKAAKQRFASVFGTMRTADIPDWVHSLGKGWDVIGGTAKKIQLSFSGFHAGALTEVALAQMRPDKGMRALMEYVVLDSIKKGTLPAYAHPEDFKLAAKHLVNLGATADYAAADVNMITEKLRNFVRDLANEQNLAKKGIGKAMTPVAAMLDFMNKGMDTVLWNYIHDGFKIACFKMFAEQVEKRLNKIYGQNGLDGQNGLSKEEMREQLLDEAGQYVNDTFGGQYWELLGVTPAQLKWMRRALLSPDWLVSTQRHFLANFGIGSLYNEGGFLEYMRYNADNLKRAFGVDIPRNELRRFRSKNAKQCYILGVCVFFYSLMNAINAIVRKSDEDNERMKAEEIRKTDPNYRSPYELAYPEGMKWYDYTMYGNTIGQQTHLLLGRYKDGTEWYARWGKQFREFPELFMGRHGVEFPAPMIERMMGKSNPMISYIRDGLGTLDVHGFDIPYQEKETVEKYGKEIAFLSMTAKHFLPFSVPTQADKEFKTWDLVMPSQKGFTRWKAVDFFKTYINAGDMHGIERTYHAAVMNNLNAEECLQAAIASVKATQKKELVDGVTDLPSAFEAFDNAKTLKERQLMRKKIIQYMTGEDYRAFTMADAREKALSFWEGDKEQTITKDNDKYIMQATAEDIRDDYKMDALYKKSNERLKQLHEIEDAGKDTRRWENSFGEWIDIHDMLLDYRRDIKDMKKDLDGSNDKEVMDKIRKLRKEVMTRIDNMDKAE